jgi:alkanesulfonate monooxygenase SsuD/methylene tetrahydromethanopterin reductase-like flavin-dependent oxidoreductase (luciferase family)
MAGLARETSSIQLVDLVSPITFRHPAVHAKMAATIQDMSGGRFTLGLGTGWMSEEHSFYGIDFPAQGQRFRMLEEQLGYLRALTSGSAFHGRHYQLEAFESNPSFVVPLLVGGTGSEKTPRLAARFADEFNLFPRSSADIAQRIDHFRNEAFAAGRDPAQVRLSFTALPVAGANEETYQSALTKAASEYDRTPEVLAERLAARGVPFGTPERINARLQELEELGISRLYLQAPTTEPNELEELVGPYLP